MTSNTEHKLNRRNFISTLAATTTAPLALPISEAEAYVPGDDETRARYRESDEVKAFYRTNRYEY